MVYMLSQQRQSVRVNSKDNTNALHWNRSVQYPRIWMERDWEEMEEAM